MILIHHQRLRKRAKLKYWIIWSWNICEVTWYSWVHRNAKQSLNMQWCKGRVCDSGERLLMFDLNSQSNYIPSLSVLRKQCIDWLELFIQSEPLCLTVPGQCMSFFGEHRLNGQLVDREEQFAEFYKKCICVSTFKWRCSVTLHSGRTWATLKIKSLVWCAAPMELVSIWNRYLMLTVFSHWIYDETSRDAVDMTGKSLIFSRVSKDCCRRLG